MEQSIIAGAKAEGIGAMAMKGPITVRMLLIMATREKDHLEGVEEIGDTEAIKCLAIRETENDGRDYSPPASGMGK